MLKVSHCRPGQRRVRRLGRSDLGDRSPAGSWCASRGALFLHAAQGAFPVQSHYARRAFSGCSGFQWVFILAGGHLKSAALFSKLPCSCTEKIEQAAAMAHPPHGFSAKSHQS